MAYLRFVNKQLKVNNQLTSPKILIFHTKQLSNVLVTWLWLSEPYLDKSDKNGQIQDLLCSSAAAGKNVIIAYAHHCLRGRCVKKLAGAELAKI